MIEASIAAVPGLIVSFLILAAVLGLPTALVAKARNKPWPLRTALAVYLAGIFAVTLLPGDAGLEPWQCDTGAPTHLLTSVSSLLNIALFAPAGFLAVQLFRRPITVAATGACVSAMVELMQSGASIGRSCSVSDLAANTAGGLIGVLAGVVWLYGRRVPPRRPMRDLVWGAALAVVGTMAVTAIFDGHITPVDLVAQDDRRRSLAESSGQAEEWITAAAKGIYGSDTEVTGSVTQKSGDRLKITAETNRGSISGWWPNKELVGAWSSNTRGDEGPLSEAEVAKAADKFARKWFPKSVAGSRQKIRSIGDGPTRAFTVAYRRYADGVMMPMRLDLTITTTARVIGFSATPTNDPALPRVTVDEAKARDLAHNETGLSTDRCVLLAQRVAGTWRPVWIVGSGKQDISIDAATGKILPGTLTP
ncbi:VanZ family protein [Streptomyces sp. Tu102]|uniref:VanZ family protein n=1 Tax=Streptomyces sp. Tu102 TaxID=2838019 RepID=UPI001BDCDD9E|nr:VanZ family protein [Streptomyces sp. Tu102]MBT1095084.1 VanZ family protein [Streptomyces sp. Tu102]